MTFQNVTRKMRINSTWTSRGRLPVLLQIVYFSNKNKKLLKNSYSRDRFRRFDFNDFD